MVSSYRYLGVVGNQNVTLRSHYIYHQYQKSVKLHALKEEKHNGAPNSSRCIIGH